MTLRDEAVTPEAEVFQAGTAFVSGLVFPSGPHWGFLQLAIEANPGHLCFLDPGALLRP